MFNRESMLKVLKHKIYERVPRSSDILIVLPSKNK
jgi:hypothetical protein